VDHISKPGETLSSKRYESKIGGKGANQAVSIVRAGGEAQFYGTVGKDGKWIVEELKEMGIDTSGVIVEEKVSCATRRGLEGLLGVGTDG